MYEDGMYLCAVFPREFPEPRCRGKIDRAASHVGFARQYFAVCLVYPVHQGSVRTEVDLDFLRVDGYLSDAPVFPRRKKHSDFRLPEAIDGLHGITYQEQAVTVFHGPPGGQFLQ